MLKETDLKSRNTYIEVEHEHGPINGEVEISVWHAVRPSPSRWIEGDSSISTTMFENSWRLEGGLPIYIHSVEDINGLRKLLDALEKEF